jgi:hypothetical protein
MFYQSGVALFDYFGVKGLIRKGKKRHQAEAENS